MKTDGLALLQTQFQDYLLSPENEDGSPPATAIRAAVAGRSGLPADQRLAIYYHAYRIRLREALQAAFAKTHLYLGDELFAQMAEAYIQAQPSAFSNLRWYGDRFADFLAQALDEHPAVAELAAFEWALGLAFDAADTAILCADDVRALTPQQWENLGFHVQPSVHMVRLHCNAVAIWQALDKEQTPPDPIHANEPAAWLIWRQQLQPHFRSMTILEADAVEGLRRGLSFAAVCDAALERAGEHDVSAQMAGWLQAWLGTGLLSSYIL